MSEKVESTLTHVAIAKLANSMGIDCTEQSSFLKYSLNRKAVYVSKTKGPVTRVDIAGMVVSHPAVRLVTADQAKAKRLGKVRGQVVVTQADALAGVKAAFQALRSTKVEGFKFLKGAGESEPGFEKAKPAAAAKAYAKVVGATVAETLAADKDDRKVVIQARAEARGFSRGLVNASGADLQ